MGRRSKGARKGHGADGAPRGDVDTDSESSHDGGDAPPLMDDALDDEAIARESGSDGSGI